MAYFSDLSPYVYIEGKDNLLAVNIGWLSKEHPYHQGKTPNAVISRLWIYCKQYVNQTRGWSACEICEQPYEYPVTALFEGEKINLGSAEIRVVGPDKKIFAAPNLILHYVMHHHYLPPDEFIQAVLMGYLPDSPEYRALREKYRW